ncbi:hypothetical protein DEO72_LG8g2261 [Vigna unguiculata]|uniref:Uncharacterized protein n=1 Tax=Vigna unguiculata TaxID=3917 RepID=A0A4D6MWF2_VIGUN|nr:hypothetical protein DEO72_LG8g2261 [Vigna unguiculata]
MASLLLDTTNTTPGLDARPPFSRHQRPLPEASPATPSPFTPLSREIVLWPTKNQLPRDLRQPKSSPATSFTTGAVTVDAGSQPFSPSLSRDRRPRSEPLGCVYSSLRSQELPYPWPLHRVTAVGDITGDILFLGASSSRTLECSAFAFSSHIVSSSLCMTPKVVVVSTSSV